MENTGAADIFSGGSLQSLTNGRSHQQPARKNGTSAVAHPHRYLPNQSASAAICASFDFHDCPTTACCTTSSGESGAGSSSFGRGSFDRKRSSLPGRKLKISRNSHYVDIMHFKKPNSCRSLPVPIHYKNGIETPSEQSPRIPSKSTPFQSIIKHCYNTKRRKKMMKTRMKRMRICWVNERMRLNQCQGFLIKI